ncbi:hypothetical protein J0910_02940 [Nocardiopsis sp. CNT-189]|uniref:hypothetical protein n=1 Tax=Nocardiopsis oceanisediminis TaxID=2816862 RepID=UPI003B39E601
MHSLDSKTLRRLAEVIADIGGPYERKGWELEELLRGAAWPGEPEYDGEARVPWLLEEMTARRDDHAAIERLLCRVCDPLEYDEGADAADAVREAVNEKLRPEGLVISQIGGRPVAGRLGAGGAVQMSEPPELEKRLRALVQDEKTAEVLLNRLEETRICASNGAYTLAIIGVGSLMEGLLLTILRERDGEAWAENFPRRQGKLVKPDQVSLHGLIEVMHRKQLIEFDAKDFMHRVRDFRNYVHPHRELVDQPGFDADSVGLCWAPVQAVLNDLEKRLG